MFNKIIYLNTHSLGAVVALWAVAPCTHAQPAGGAYPERPIRMIAAQSAGSSLDTILRIFAQKMTDVLDQQPVRLSKGRKLALIFLAWSRVSLGLPFANYGE